jgi:hypothetical protein
LQTAKARSNLLFAVGVFGTQQPVTFFIRKGLAVIQTLQVASLKTTRNSVTSFGISCQQDSRHQIIKIYKNDKNLTCLGSAP